MWYRTGTLSVTGGLSPILSVRYDCVWPGKVMLACYLVQLKMASWIMVLSLGTFGPSEYILIALMVLSFFFKERRRKAWKIESFFAFTVNLISKLNLHFFLFHNFFSSLPSPFARSPGYGCRQWPALSVFIKTTGFSGFASNADTQDACCCPHHRNNPSGSMSN